MADRQHWTAAQVVEALTKNKGMVYYAAKSLGCSHTTIYNYAKRYASVREVMEAQDGEFVDTAELNLRQAVINGEAWAVLFAVPTHGKGRGYVERQDEEHTWKTYLNLEDYLRSPEVLVIRAADIKPEERVGSLPRQGYVWVDED